MVNKNDPWSLENEGPLKISLLFLNLEFSWHLELLFVKAAFDVSGLVFFLKNRYIEEYLRDQCELRHLLLGDKKTYSVSMSITSWKWLFTPTLCFNILSQKKRVLIPKITVILPVLYCDSTVKKRACVSRKSHMGYSAVPQEIISGLKPGSLLYQDQALWFSGKYQSW